LGGSQETFSYGMRLLVDRENFIVFLYLWSTVASVAHEVLGRLHAWSAIAPNNLAIQQSANITD